MKTFKDELGQEWELDIKVGTLLAIKEQLGIDLLDAPGEMPTSLEKCVEILHVCMRKQAKERDLGLQDFADCLSGSSLAVAIDAFMEELGAFFFSIQKSKGMAIQGLWQQTKKVEQLQEEQVEKVLGILSSVWEGSADKTQETSSSGS